VTLLWNRSPSSRRNSCTPWNKVSGQNSKELRVDDEAERRMGELRRTIERAKGWQ